jgi:hypothetical protein
MKWLKYITMTFAIGYTIIGLYYDTFEYKNQKLIDIIKLGDALISTDYRVRKFGDNIRTFYPNKVGTLLCLKNMELKYIDVEETSYRVVYRGSEENGLVICEMKTYLESEGPTSGEPKAYIIWFNASDADKYSYKKH